MKMDQDRRDAAAWAKEWQIKRKNRRLLYVLAGILAIALIGYLISFLVVHTERSTYGSEEEMRAACQGRYEESNYYEDLIIEGDQVTLTYLERSHYDRDYAERYGYEYEYNDSVYEDRVIEWDYRHGVIKTEWMGELMREGKIRAWGVSEATPSQIRRAHAVTPVSAVENMYNVIDRGTEALFPTFEELGITMVAFTPLAKGFLSGTYTERPTFDHPEDNRGGRYQFSEEGFAYYQDALALIRDLADAKGATMAQIALAWMMNEHDYIVPIPGTRTPSRMQENADASDIVFSAEELARLNEALDRLNLVDTTVRRIR